MARKRQLIATTKNQKAVLKKINYNVSGIDLSGKLQGRVFIWHKTSTANVGTLPGNAKTM